ncbi:hypothetical protein [Parapedobacter lycopersici]|uniref:hypothetical protein n=1 Tax=Parapedobacter lycopersici TaxID=1864939 RepID=UPI003341279E
MNTKNNIITFALVGLAAGTITWLLLGTKEGRKQLSCASDGIRQFTDSMKNNAKKGLDKAAEMANKASKEAQDMRAKATNSGKSMLNKADQAAKKSINKAADAMKTARRKTDIS